MNRAHIVVALIGTGLTLMGCQMVVEPLPLDTASLVPQPSRTLVFLDTHGWNLRADPATVEAELAGRLSSIGGASSVAILGDIYHPQLDDVQTIARREGFDSILILSIEDMGPRRSPDVAFLPVEGASDFRWDPVVVGNVSRSAVFRVSLFKVADSQEVWAAKITRHNADLGVSDFRAVARAVVRQLRTDGILH
jgi:hypothetical protein